MPDLTDAERAEAMRRAAILALQNCLCGGGHRLAILEKKIDPSTPNPCGLCGPLWAVVDPPPAPATPTIDRDQT